MRTNNNSSTCRVLDDSTCTNLGIVLGIPCVEGNRLEVETTVKIDGGDNVLQSWNNALDSGDVLLLESQSCWGGRDLRRGGC